MSGTRYLAALTLIAAMAFAPSVNAAEKSAFAPRAFDQALKAGDPVLVEIHADWCPTCKAQDAILTPLEAKSRYSRLKVFRVDFDVQKDIVKQFRARMQSTLIVFKGGAEVGRSVGDTDSNTIEMLLDSAL